MAPSFSFMSSSFSADDTEVGISTLIVTKWSPAVGSSSGGDGREAAKGSEWNGKENKQIKRGRTEWVATRAGA